MTWARLDDQFTDHPKVVEAGPMAGWLYVCGLTYSTRYLTDGFIPRAQVKRLADLPDCEDLAGRLVKVGLWEVVEGGYRIHDYLEYNRSAADVRAERDESARRQADWRAKKAEERRNGVSHAVTEPSGPDAVTSDVPVLSGTPVLSEVTTRPESGAGARAPARAAPPPAELQEFHSILAKLPGYEPSAQFYAKVGEKYGHLDLVEEAIKLASWIRDRPPKDDARCSTGRVLNWLKKSEEQRIERGKEVSSYAPGATVRNGSPRRGIVHG